VTRVRRLAEPSVRDKLTPVESIAQGVAARLEAAAKATRDREASGRLRELAEIWRDCAPMLPLMTEGTVAP
jgi:hypothetical protein